MTVLKRKQLLLLLGSFFFLITLLAIYSSESRKENAFLEKFPTTADMNSGLTLRLYDAEEAISLVVENSSSEFIKFPDAGFSYNIYTYDSTRNEWQQVKTLELLLPEEKIVRNQLSAYENLLQNFHIVFRDHLVLDEDVKVIRIMISGIGVESEIVYGAFSDFRIP